MNIYFACSITGGREFEGVYQQIVAALTADGHVIPTSHLVESEVFQNEKALTPEEIYLRDITWIQNCDALVAEVSTPSHGVGYEIGFALNAGKPVFCIHQNDRRVSKMITGNKAVHVAGYSDTAEAVEKIREFLSPR